MYPGRCHARYVAKSDYYSRGLIAIVRPRTQEVTMKRHYIVCVRDDNLRLIGPFESRDDMGIWAATNNPADDPRWQSIELDLRPEPTRGDGPVWGYEVDVF